MDNAKPYRPSQTWESVIAEADRRRAYGQDMLVLDHAGATTVVAFVGEPFAFEAVWEDANGWVPYNPSYTLHQSVEPALRILIMVIPQDAQAGIWSAVWEMGVDTFKQLVKLREKYGLDDWLYIIERLDNDDAEPGYQILPARKVDQDLKSKIACMPRICLARLKGLPEYDAV